MTKPPKTVSGTLLVVDDNQGVLRAVEMALYGQFDRVATLSNPAAIPQRLRELKPCAVLLDMNFRSGVNSGNEGLFWLREIKKAQPLLPVVLMTAYADVALAVQGMKEGAADFVVKPFDNEQLAATLRAALANGNGTASHASTAEAPAPAPAAEPMYWGRSQAMADLRTLVEKVAPTDANILITGENGTGKEVLAREIHRLSRRAAKPFEQIDMGAITETLFESELFGYEPGAFTDAKGAKAGKMELANGGTLLLDEIGNLSYPLQAKLLNALQQRRVTRVGGTRPTDIDVRLLCATNRDLTAMVGEGTFREDLLYRINTIHLHLPALRERPQDIAPLAQRFVDLYGRRYGREGLVISPSTREAIERLPWHGNIRELQHAVERAVIFEDLDALAQPAPQSDSPAAEAKGTATPAGVTLEDVERETIAEAVRACDGNMSMVARRLGVSRQTLYNKLRKYGL